MLLGQAATRLIRRIRFPSLTTSPACRTTCNVFPFSLSEEMKFSHQNGSRGYTRSMSQGNPCLWILICGHAGILLGINANPVFAKDMPTQSSSEIDTEGAGIIGLRKVEDGSVISNIHTSKWRVFTDNGRDLSLRGKLDEAERYFLSALQEAKEGFGERDPHVASACNNLAELYRVKKEFDKAEPLYLEAIKILEESFGSEDIRVGAAFRNLGQFYLVQRKLDEAHVFYERALKIQGRVLGHDHADYSDTMFHLGTVLYLQGKEKDSEALIQNSISILEEGGQGESLICLKRLRYLSQVVLTFILVTFWTDLHSCYRFLLYMKLTLLDNIRCLPKIMSSFPRLPVYLKSNHPAEAENVQRKILHIMELSKGWNSLDTVIAAEGLALTLQSVGNLKEAGELLERCLDARKTLLSEDHIQIGANMLHMARVAMLHSNQLRNLDISGANDELENAKDLLDNSIRIARQVLDKLGKQKGNLRSFGAPGETRKDARVALIILLQSLIALGLLEITKQDAQDSQITPTGTLLH